MAEASGAERHATWLELFFDLVFVAAITMIGSQLAAQHSAAGVLAYMALFVPIWWAWVGHTVFSNRFERDDLYHRGLTAVLMLAAAGMAVQVGHIEATGGLGFAAAYVVSRVCLLLLYAREGETPDIQAMRRIYLVGFGLGAVVWIVSFFFPPPIRYGLWAAGMAVDLLTPWFGWSVLKRLPLNVEHIPERMGLFTLILLGESIVVVVDGISHVAWGTGPVVIATLAFGLALSIWSMYFAFVASTPFSCRLGSGQPYIYSHLVLALGLTALAGGIHRAIEEAGHAHLEPATLLLLGLGGTIWFMSFLLVKLVSYYARPMKGDMLVFSLAALATLGVVVVGGSMPPLSAIGGLTLIFVVVAIAEWRLHRDVEKADHFIEISDAP